MSKDGEVESSISERPEHHRPRRLADWINPTRARKVHSLIDKVSKRKNLQIAWEQVKANVGAGGVDGERIEAFGERLDERLNQLHEELRTERYQPQPIRQRPIPKAGKPSEQRMLGIPTIYDRVCQQALLNRLEPIFEPVFDRVNHDLLMSKLATKIGDAPQHLCRERTGWHGLLQSLTRFLGERLKLMVNVSKSTVARPWQRKFLGYSVTWHQEPKLNWGWCRCSIRCSGFSGFMNRRMRNRMYGGVEGDRGDPVPYPI